MSDDMMIDLRRRFRLRCIEDLAVLCAARQSSTGLASSDFGVVVHRLSGAAGSFGFGELSRLARVIDDVLMQDEVPAVADLDRLQSALAAVVEDQHQ